ncbi:MAG: CPBP family intramembrane metalloprotease [Treponema sp.]|nr:CPBP family intramembrane metalloprotease [Treponema sp.]
MDKRKIDLFIICIFPLFVLLIQLIPIKYVLLTGILFLITIFIFPYYKNILLVFCITLFGYILWNYINNNLISQYNISDYASIILNRFSLVGYLIPFIIWHFIQRPKNKIIGFGDYKASIKFPLIWNGFNEIIWRFTLVFITLCLSIVLIFIFTKQIYYDILIYGIIFSIINAIFEEYIWRGFILSRIIDISNEIFGLIITSITFGLYHYSLNFPIWICLLFSIGGFYMGGAAIKSKGLVSPIIMHIMVNLVFVSMA